MKPITSLPKVANRLSSDDFDLETLRSYSVGDATLLLEGTETLTTKKDIFEKILLNFNDFNKSGRKPIHIWVCSHDVSFMVLYTKPLNNGFFEFVVSSYKGDLQIKWGDSETYKLDFMSQSFDTIICHIDNISYIQLGNYHSKFDSDVVKYIIGDGRVKGN